MEERSPALVLLDRGLALRKPASTTITTRAQQVDHTSEKRLWPALVLVPSISPVRREGLRLDVRRAVAGQPGAERIAPGWRPLEVSLEDGGGRVAGWWREEPGWVMAIAGGAAPRRAGRPRCALTAREGVRGFPHADP